MDELWLAGWLVGGLQKQQAESQDRSREQRRRKRKRNSICISLYIQGCTKKSSDWVTGSAWGWRGGHFNFHWQRYIEHQQRCSTVSQSPASVLWQRVVLCLDRSPISAFSLSLTTIHHSLPAPEKGKGQEKAAQQQQQRL